jgi:PIN domain nuclease of toxin-antitoxin system
MKLLLDTCSLLWALQTPEKLGAKARSALQSEENSIHISPVSFWEISLKFALGKLQIEGATPEDMPDFVAREGWHLLDFQAPTVASFHCLPSVPDHKDPFDRLLIWTAIRENLTFVSKDGALSEYEALGLKICK